jgi:predicted acylesterase/phospholipase RssA
VCEADGGDAVGLLELELDQRVVDAVGVVATAAATGGSVVFLQAGEHVPPPFDAVNGIRYAPARLSTEHVLASCSIPVFFPPREVHEPAEARGWYWDGGTRLNRPISPALAIGVGRVVIVSTGPSHHPSPAADDPTVDRPRRWRARRASPPTRPRGPARGGLTRSGWRRAIRAGTNVCAAYRKRPSASTARPFADGTRAQPRAARFSGPWPARAASRRPPGAGRQSPSSSLIARSMNV